MTGLELAAFFVVGGGLLLRYLAPPTMARWRAWRRTPPAVTHLLTVLRAGRRRRELVFGLAVEELLGIGMMLGYAAAVVVVALTVAS